MRRSFHLLLALSSVSFGAPCVPVEGDRILARHLAVAVPSFLDLPADTALGHAPAPGAQRVFRLAELDRMAKTYNIQLGTPAEVCVEYPTEPLTPERIAAAIRAIPSLAEAEIDVVDFSRNRVPRGDTEFPLTGLTAPPGADPKSPILWKGLVRYSSNRRFAIWARVKISVTGPRIVASESLRSGQPISESQVRVEEHTGFLPPQHAVSLDQVIGRLPRRPISAGNPLLLSMLDSPKEIARGDLVDIEVRSGAARLALVGKAQAAGALGDTIPVLNPVSKKTFLARVEGKGKAMVTAGVK